MIRYELKKLLRGQTAALFAALLLLNVFLVAQLRAPGAGWDHEARDVQTLYAAIADLEPQDAGERLYDLHERLLDSFWNNSYDGPLITGGVDGDLGVVGAVLDRVQETAAYPAYLENVLATQAHLLTLPVYRDLQSFGRRNLQVSGEVYSRLTDVKPRLCYTGMAETLPGGRITDVLLLFFALLTALTLFSEERKHRTLLLPLRRGRGPLFLAKLAAGGILLALGVLLLYGCNLLVGLLRCGMTPPDAPIQSVFGFQQSPWHITVGGYYALSLLAKWIAVCCVSGVLALACNAVRNPIGAAALGLGLLFAAAQPEQFSSPLLSAGGLLRLRDTERMFQSYLNLDLFGYPVPEALFSLSLWVCLGGLCLGCAAVLWRVRSPIPTERKRIVGLRRKKKTGTLFCYEARKLLLTERGLLILLAFLCLQLWTYRDFPDRLGSADYLYLDYADVLKGAPDAEKDAWLERRQEKYDTVYAQLAELDGRLESGQIPPESYQIQAGMLQQELYGEELLQKVRRQYDQAKQNDGQFVSLLGWERLFGRRGVKDLIGLGIKLCIALSLGLSSVFAMENETGMAQILSCAVRKKYAWRYRRILAAGYTAIAFFIATIPHLSAVRTVYGIDGLVAPAASVPQFPISIGTVGLSSALYLVGALLLSSIASMLICLLSKRFRRIIPVLIASTACLVSPQVLLLLAL